MSTTPLGSHPRGFVLCYNMAMKKYLGVIGIILLVVTFLLGLKVFCSASDTKTLSCFKGLGLSSELYSVRGRVFEGTPFKRVSDIIEVESVGAPFLQFSNTHADYIFAGDIIENDRYIRIGNRIFVGWGSLFGEKHLTFTVSDNYVDLISDAGLKYRSENLPE